jgi:GntR family negative regulator for fad regulon and positive regulator of fabA
VRNYWLEGNLGVLSAIARYPEHAPEAFIPNLLAVRELMAPAYARQAIERAPDLVIELLGPMLDLADDPAVFALADWELHHRLTVLSGNPIYTLILNGFEELYLTMGRAYFGLEATRIHSRAFYHDLLAAATAGNLETAEKLTQETMATSLNLWGEVTNPGELEGGAQL